MPTHATDRLRACRQDLRRRPRRGRGGRRRRLARGRRGRIPGHRRRLRLGQDHAAAAGQPADRGRRAARITVEGEDVRSVDPIGLRRRIGYVFQSGGLFPHLSVAGNIGITPKLLGMACGGDCRAGGRTARSGAARPRAVPRPPAARTVRRPAPARRRRAGAGGKAPHRADGRAVRRARSPDPRCARRRFSRAASQARADHGHDHPRHDGGDPARRPRRA